MENLLSVENLSYAYQDEKILSNLNFEVNEGDFVVIVGTNGSGKSTLIKIILQDLKIQDGRINLYSQDISDFKRWRDISYVAQNNIELTNGFPATALEIVRLGLYNEVGVLKPFAHKDKEKAKEALDVVGMLDYKDRLISELSGGQQQRVMLAKALVSNPKLLIMDEPTNGVDIQSTYMIYDLLKKASLQRNLTIIMITHDVDKIMDYANRFYYLKDGTLKEVDKDSIEVLSKF